MMFLADHTAAADSSRSFASTVPVMLFVMLVLALFCASVSAVIETYEFSAPELEQRYHRLSQELRCPKCQNQNIADSNAPIAQDLRQLLFTQLEAGATDEEILADMVSRYGEFVRYRPDATGITLWLWLAPLIMLGVGGVFLVLIVRRGRAESGAPMSNEEKQRLDALLGDSSLTSGVPHDVSGHFDRGDPR